MSVLCLVAGLMLVPVGEAVTLRWEHSVQKVLWEEDYRGVDGKLHLLTARVRGSGAGMEAPLHAVFLEGAWHYQPSLAPLNELVLRHSPYVAPYVLCNAQHCQSLPEWLPGLEADLVLLRPCSLP